VSTEPDEGIAVLLAIAMVLLHTAVDRLRKWLRRRRVEESWILVEGRIDTHEAQLYTRGKLPAYYEAAVGYSYYFQGKYHSGLHSLGEVQWLEDAEKKSQGFPIGTPVKIFVNPDRPEESLFAD